VDYEWEHGEYLVSTDRRRIDVEAVHAFLTTSYWARGVSLDRVARSIDNSVPLGLYRDTQQAGFARVITDYATFGYLADVFVLEPHRGRGLGRRLVEAALEHPELQGFRKWLLATRDAHGLYRQLGFTDLANPQQFMQRVPPNAPDR